VVANPTWDPNGAWTNVLDDGDPWVTIPAHWEQGWFAASGISSPVNSTSPKNNSANLAISGGVLNMTVGNISGTPYGSLMTTNPSNSGTSTGFTLTPPYAFECQVNIPGPHGSVLVPNWVAVWSDGQNWPGDGEVDTIESLGTPDWNSFHVHDSVSEASGGPTLGATHNMSPNPYGLHTIGHVRTATTVSFYYDGVLVGTEPINTTSPHFIILTHTYNGSADVLPSVLGVHWVRAWTPGTATTTGMTVTATASGSQASAGTALSVRVLTGATTSQGGSVVHSEALATPALTITPAATGSVVYGAISNGLAQSFAQRDAATTIFQNVGDATTNEGYLTFRGTAATTAGQAVTLGASSPAAGSQMFGVLAEIEAAAGKTIAEDPSSPAGVFAQALSATTAGFTPPGGAVLVAIASVNYNNAGTPTVAVAVTDSTGLTWTQVIGNSGAAGQDLTSVWIAGASVTPNPPPPPITGPPATARPLIIAAAPKAGTDVYGNAFPQGIQVGAGTGAQVQVVPLSGGAQVRFPVPAPLLSNVPNLAALGTSAVQADLVLSGPALAAAGHQDWAQLVAFSSDGSAQARLELRYVDTTGTPAVTAEYNGSQWLFNILTVFAAVITAQDPANPGTFEPWHSLGSYPSGTTTRGQYRLTPEGETEIDINLTGTPASGTSSFPNAMPAAYRPNVTKRIPAVQGAGTGWITISTAGVVSCTIAAGGTSTFDCPGRINLS
jgi:hypothetical protein